MYGMKGDCHKATDWCYKPSDCHTGKAWGIGSHGIKPGSSCDTSYDNKWSGGHFSYNGINADKNCDTHSSPDRYSCNKPTNCCWTKSGNWSNSCSTNWHHSNCGNGSHLSDWLTSSWGSKSLVEEFADIALFYDKTTNSYKVSLAVPGVKQKNLELAVHSNPNTGCKYIDVKWHRDCESSKNDHDVKFVGRIWSACHKIIPIPSCCDADAISCELSDGHLLIIMPKKHCGDNNSRSIKVRFRG